MTDEPTHTYEVVLAADVADELGIDDRVQTDRIDYYDSGLWVTRPEGRDFFPYDRVLAIRERPAAPASEASTAEAESSGDVQAATEQPGDPRGDPVED